MPFCWEEVGHYFYGLKEKGFNDGWSMIGAAPLFLRAKALLVPFRDMSLNGMVLVAETQAFFRVGCRRFFGLPPCLCLLEMCNVFG